MYSSCKFNAVELKFILLSLSLKLVYCFYSFLNFHLYKMSQIAFLSLSEWRFQFVAKKKKKRFVSLPLASCLKNKCLSFACKSQSWQMWLWDHLVFFAQVRAWLPQARGPLVLHQQHHSRVLHDHHSHLFCSLCLRFSHHHPPCWMALVPHLCLHQRTGRMDFLGLLL